MRSLPYSERDEVKRSEFHENQQEIATKLGFFLQIKINSSESASDLFNYDWRNCSAES